MPDITRERQGEIVRAVFKVLIDNPEGLQAKVVIEKAAGMLELTEYEKSFYPTAPGTTRFDKNLRFSTISAVKAGWMVKSKGEWTITDEGREAYETILDPGDFMRESIRRYQAWKKNRQQEDAGDEADDDVVVPDGVANTTLEEAEEASFGEVKRYLQNMPPYDFQELVAALLRAMDYHVAWVSPQGRDGGIDVLAYTDPLGAEGPRIKVQVKRYAEENRIGVEGVRSFMAVLGAQDVGIFVTTSSFTKDAAAEVRSQDNRRVMLVNLQRLFDLWVEHYDELTDEDQQRLPLKPVHFLIPAE